MRVRRTGAGALIAGLTFILLGCSGQPTTPTASPTGATRSESTSSPDDSTGEQAVLDAYKNFFTLGLTAGGLSEAEIRQLLGPYATTEIVNRIVLVVSNQAADGLVPAGNPTFGDPQAAISGSTATVADCRDSTTEQVVDAQTGEVVFQGDPRTKYDVSMVLGDDERWRVSGYEVVAGAC